MEISKLMKRSLAEACGTTNKQQTQIMFSSCKIDTTKFNWLLDDHCLLYTWRYPIGLYISPILMKRILKKLIIIIFVSQGFLGNLGYLFLLTAFWMIRQLLWIICSYWPKNKNKNRTCFFVFKWLYEIKVLLVIYIQ